MIYFHVLVLLPPHLLRELLPTFSLPWLLSCGPRASRLRTEDDFRGSYKTTQCISQVSTHISLGVHLLVLLQISAGRPLELNLAMEHCRRKALIRTCMDVLVVLCSAMRSSADGSDKKLLLSSLLTFMDALALTRDSEAATFPRSAARRRGCHPALGSS